MYSEIEYKFVIYKKSMSNGSPFILIERKLIIQLT